MDGLILDTETTYRAAIMETAAEFGYPLPDDFFLQLIGLPSDVGLTLWHNHLGPDADINGMLRKARDRFYARVDIGDLLKPGLVDLLDTLARLGLPYAIATSSKHDAVAHHLGAHGLYDRFPVIVAHGDYALGKPNPDPFLLAAKRLDLAPQDCIALEDSHNGIRAASSAGLMTVMVPDLLEPTPEIAALCTLVVKSLRDVKDLLLETVNA
jgi:HAD superfamily hydrolase (TIGR01509 family)